MPQLRCDRCDAPISEASRRRGRCEGCNAPVSMLGAAARQAPAAGVVVGDGDADPSAMTVADLTFADLRRAQALAGEAATSASPPPRAAPASADVPTWDELPSAEPPTREPPASATRQAALTGGGGATAPSGSLRRYQDGGVVTLDGESAAGGAAPTDVLELPYRAAAVVMRIGGYDVVSELGRGGMGVVYKAYSLRLCRFVALKMMTAGRHASEAELVRFQNEAMLAARLSHPNIVPVFDAGEHEGNFFFVMAFVEGRSLGSVIEDRSEAGLRLGVTLARAGRARRRLCPPQGHCASRYQAG